MRGLTPMLKAWKLDNISYAIVSPSPSRAPGIVDPEYPRGPAVTSINSSQLEDRPCLAA